MKREPLIFRLFWQASLLMFGFAAGVSYVRYKENPERGLAERPTTIVINRTPEPKPLERKPDGPIIPLRVSREVGAAFRE